MKNKSSHTVYTACFSIFEFDQTWESSESVFCRFLRQMRLKSSRTTLAAVHLSGVSSLQLFFLNGPGDLSVFTEVEIRRIRCTRPQRLRCMEAWEKTLSFFGFSERLLTKLGELVNLEVQSLRCPRVWCIPWAWMPLV